MAISENARLSGRIVGNSITEVLQLDSVGAENGDISN